MFVKAFSKNAISAYDGIRLYKAYITTIARNSVIDYLRKKNKDPLSLLHYDDSKSDNHALEPVSRVIEKQSSQVYDEAQNSEENIHWQRCLSASDAFVANLNDLQKQFVTLRYRQGLVQLEVAKKMNITRWKVRSLENKIEKGLRKYLKKQKLLEE